MTATADELRDDSKLYETYCSKVIHRAQAHGASTAMHLFISMVNPKMRGPAFTWEGFPKMAANTAAATAWHGFTIREWRRYGPLIKEDASRSALSAAEQCLKDSGVQGWLPLPSGPSGPVPE